MRFSPEFLDELKSRIRPSDLIGRTVKLKKRGDAWWGLSPFKPEKTPSFTVSDRRGSYHCFSTSNHGNVFDFLIATEGLTFPEAVERLAAEAGMPLPAGDGADAARAQRRKGLAEACEEAARFFEAALRRAGGRAGADYLNSRGVSAEEIAAFRIGYAPDERGALKDHLINKGYTEDLLVEAGLVATPEGGGPAYDRFRHRVIFPILGSKDEPIAFGGRALDPDARAKYLNSPETPLFRKGEVLYNYGVARAAAAKDGAALVVCEGYLDVIALWRAGLTAAVAPLGTALTEAQLALLWRQSDEPILCFDGDAAGRAAAYRAIDRGLAMLKPAKSLRFVFLPDGQDPDDLVRTGGAAAVKAALAGALPLSEVLWRRETEARVLDTPERRAGLRAALRDLIRTIPDKDVRLAYSAEFLARLDAAFAPPPKPATPWRGAVGKGRPGGRAGGKWATPEPRISADLRNAGAPSSWRREATLLLAALNHPGLVDRKEAEFHRLALENADLDQLLRDLLAVLMAAPGLDRAGLNAHLQTSKAVRTLERVLADDSLGRQAFLRPAAELDEVETGWSDVLRLHLITTEARRAVAEAATDAAVDGEGWRASVIAREELANARFGRDGGLAGAQADDDVSSGDLGDRLARLGASVGAKRKRRSGSRS